MFAFAQAEAVLFDLDGTLIDSAPDLGWAADQLRIRRGLPSMPFEHYRPMAGAGARGMVQQALGVVPGEPCFEALRDEFLDIYGGCLTERTHPFDGVAELIRAIQDRGLPWGVVTNKAHRFTMPLTAALPLFESAITIVSGDTTPHAKPHPAPLFEAARRAGVPPERCVYVGDDQRDIVAGKAAGMWTVAASYGYLGVVSDIAQWQADACIHSPAELLQYLPQA